MKKIYLILTPSEVMALTDIVAHYLTIPGHSEVFIDVVRQVETRPEELLTLLLDARATTIE